ncbi:MAG: tetraacyldisaccharide 4'-kinase [Lentimonas sp.]|jgi:tetraacyldisaccharide 4'-kinase
MFRKLSEKLMQKADAFAQFTVDVIYDRQQGKAAEWYAFFLNLLSYIYSFAVRLRLYLYKHRIFRNKPLGCLVVVVGNLTVGGTGKTPIVEKFARTLTERGRKVAILSRGYKSKKEPLLKKFWRKLSHGEEVPPKIVSDGKRVLLDSEVAGDEPYMLAKNLPGVVVLCDKNRVKAGSFAIRRYGCDTLILDDGFQYLPLKGRLNLLLVDKTNPFGNQHLLPRGILREPIKHLSRASYIFLTKSNGTQDEALLELIREHNPKAEIIECAHQPQFLQSIEDGKKHSLDILQGARIAAFSGIASPESFENMLRGFGAEIRYNRRFLDHHRFTRSEIKNLYNKAFESKLDMIVTTEKDAVRLFQDIKPKIPIYFLRLEIDILSGEEDFEAATARICLPRNVSAQGPVSKRK